MRATDAAAAAARAWGLVVHSSDPYTDEDGRHWDNIRLGDGRNETVVVQVCDGVASVDLIIPTGAGPFYEFEVYAEDVPLDELALLARPTTAGHAPTA